MGNKSLQKTLAIQEWCKTCDEIATMPILTSPLVVRSAKSNCPIPCFGSLGQPKIPTPAAIQILIYLPMFGLTRNRLTMYGYTVVFKFKCFGMIFRQNQCALIPSAINKTL